MGELYAFFVSLMVKEELQVISLPLASGCYYGLMSTNLTQLTELFRAHGGFHPIQIPKGTDNMYNPYHSSLTGVAPLYFPSPLHSKYLNYKADPVGRVKVFSHFVYILYHIFESLSIVRTEDVKSIRFPCPST